MTRLPHDFAPKQWLRSEPLLARALDLLWRMALVGAFIFAFASLIRE